jgi:hypothetical protein
MCGGIRTWRCRLRSARTEIPVLTIASPSEKPIHRLLKGESVPLPKATLFAGRILSVATRILATATTSGGVKHETQDTHDEDCALGADP